MVAHQPTPADAPGPRKAIIAVSRVSHRWIKDQAEAESRRRDRTFTQPEVIERLIRHWKRTGARWDDE